MRFPWLLFLAISAFADEPLIENEVIIHLNCPAYHDGILSTTQGGVIQNEEIRIQARSIHYTQKGQVHTIDAEGDLLVQYRKRVFVGTSLHYDFTEKRGEVIDGRTSFGSMYLGAAKIELNPDGSFEATDAFMTACENRDCAWDLHSGYVRLEKCGLAETKNTTFRLLGVPVFWLPSFKVNLCKFTEPIFDYDLRFDSKMGPRASIRYQFYSWEDFAMFGRLEYRWSVGWGGAFETEYFPTEHKTRFVTRNYLAKDRLEPAPNARRRYRLIGDFEHISENDKTTTVASWDKYSDVRMQSDFKQEDFELNRAKKTVFYVGHRDEPYIASFKVRPRFNTFESIQQDLPTGYFSLIPLELGHTGIYSSTLAKASYLDFAYSNQLVTHLPSYHSARVELREKLYRPIQAGPITITPLIGADGIFYSNSPSSQVKWFGLLAYGLKGDARAIRQYEHVKHQIEPYLEFSGLTKPSVSPDHHYIFSIQDGLDKINQVRLGVKNLLFGKKSEFTGDAFVNAFFADLAIPQLVPYGYLNLTWNLPSVFIDWQNSWNFRESVLQYSNARLKWTLNENIALTLEGRYRSRFDWRKSDHENFILDVTRSQSEMLLSPLSDRRITLLTNLYIRLNPFWECRFQSHNGFYRTNQPPYTELMFDLATWLSTALKLHLTYRYTDYTKPNFPHHFIANLELVK